MSTIDPVPKYFTLRYIAWLAWTNSLTILITLQGIFSAITLDPTIMDHATAHHCMIASCILGIVIAQIKRNAPPGPAPTKGNT